MLLGSVDELPEWRISGVALAGQGSGDGYGWHGHELKVGDRIHPTYFANGQLAWTSTPYGACPPSLASRSHRPADTRMRWLNSLMRPP